MQSLKLSAVAFGLVLIAACLVNTGSAQTFYSNYGVLDMETGNLIITNNPTVENPTIDPDVEYTKNRNYLIYGRNGGLWYSLTQIQNGQAAGITSSAAAANTSRSVALVRNKTAGGSVIWTNTSQIPEFTTPAIPTGVLDTGDILLKYTYNGDANLDGLVTFDDFQLFQPNYNQAGKGWYDGDWNYDGQVTFDDFQLFQPNYNATPQLGNVEPVGVVGAGAAVPEPSTMALAVFGAVVGFWFYRRKS